MNKEEIKEFLRDRPGYLKEGAERLSERLNCSVNTCKDALAEARLEAKESFQNGSSNENVITEFEKFLDLNGIHSNNVTSVKFWQT